MAWVGRQPSLLSRRLQRRAPTHVHHRPHCHSSVELASWGTVPHGLRVLSVGLVSGWLRPGAPPPRAPRVPLALTSCQALSASAPGPQPTPRAPSPLARPPACGPGVCLGPVALLQKPPRAPSAGRETPGRGWYFPETLPGSIASPETLVTVCRAHTGGLDQEPFLQGTRVSAHRKSKIAPPGKGENGSRRGGEARWGTGRSVFLSCCWEEAGGRDDSWRAGQAGPSQPARGPVAQDPIIRNPRCCRPGLAHRTQGSSCPPSEGILELGDFDFIFA